MNLVTRIAEGQGSLRPRAIGPREILPFNVIIQGDCIPEMSQLPDKSVDMIFASSFRAIASPR